MFDKDDAKEYMLHQMSDDGNLVQVENHPDHGISPIQLDYGVHLDSGSMFHLYCNTEHIKHGTERELKDKFNHGSKVGSRDGTMEGE